MRNPMNSVFGGARNGRGCPALLALSFLSAEAQTSFKFDFGSGPAETGYIQVSPTLKYPGSQGFGFENTAGITAVDRGGSDALRGDYVTSSQEMSFSVKLPQGDYHVTFILGDAQGTSSTTVRAENWRLLWDRATTASGQSISRTFTVDRREAKSLDGTVTMGLKDRELTYFTWDDKLTLRFSGSRPALAGLEITKAEDHTTLYLCGNSTVVDQLDPDNLGFWSWGQIIPMFFKTGVSIANYAESGLDAGAFLGMRRLSKLLSEAKAGDYVFVEFGHNDQKNGSGPYIANLKSFHTQIKAKGAIPVFVSPTCRKSERDPKTSIGGLAEAMRKTAAELNVPLIDLNAMSITVMSTLGANHSAAYKDGSHFTLFGSFELARCVAKGIMDSNLPVSAFLANDLPVFDPAKPDAINYFTLPGTVAIRADVRRARTAVPKSRFMQSGEGAGAGLIGFQAGDGAAPHAADGKRLPE